MLAGSGTAGVLILSIASKVSLVSPVTTSRLNVPAIEARPSPAGFPGGTVELKTDVATKFAFSNACTVTAPGVPGTSSTVAKSNDTLL